MGNLIFNVALGFANAYAQNVNDNNPANSAIVIALFEGVETDDNIGDLDTLAAVEANANLAESTATNYARIVLTDADIGASTVDDVTNTRSWDVSDQVFSSIGPGNAITRIVFAYDEDTTAGTDANVIPVSVHDFPVTPNGGDVTAQPAASGVWQASRA